MDRRFFAIGAASAFLGVMAGAFGAHALGALVAASHLAIWETAARYQIIHALALLAVGWAAERWPGRLIEAAGWLFVVGTVCFSGSLHLMALTGAGWLGPVTPLGGLAFLGGWGCLVWGSLRA